ncbi:MAG: DUF190 domain-containing protein [Rhizonema sp. PD38]|nr:DUF190 domain-containing protein [Rhizonema sp. PD38]
MTQWKQLTIYVDESAHWKHQPAYTAVMELAWRHGLAGATAIRAIEGFRKNSSIHTANLLGLSSDLPVVITLIDSEDGDRRIPPNCSTNGGNNL